MSAQLSTPHSENGDRFQRITPTRAEQRKIDREWEQERNEWTKIKGRARSSDGGGMSLQAIDSKCHQVIRASAVRHGWEAIEDRTPLHELVALSPDPTTAEREAARQEGWNALLDWLFQKGPHPALVMRQVYALAYQQNPRLIAYMTMADLGLLLGETKAAFSWRLKQLFPGKLRSRSQKREGAREKYAAAARGNRSRRKGEQRKRRNQKTT